MATNTERIDANTEAIRKLEQNFARTIALLESARGQIGQLSREVDRARHRPEELGNRLVELQETAARLDERMKMVERHQHRGSERATHLLIAVVSATDAS
jgi:chromosome segregation ATPase